MTELLEPNLLSAAKSWQRLGFGFLWLGFVSYAFLLAPPDRPETFTLIQNLATGQWQGVNSLIVMVFNLMGVWPMVYSIFMLRDGHGRKLWAWPFALASFAVGAFAILPYLALRQPAQATAKQPSWFLRLLESRWLGLLLLAGSLVLVGLGLAPADWPAFIQQWQTSRFIHVMSLDFVMLSLVSLVILGEDLERRHLPLVWRNLALIPLLGPCLYLFIRPSLRPSAMVKISPERG